jgi:hypothetical protein
LAKRTSELACLAFRKSEGKCALLYRYVMYVMEQLVGRNNLHAEIQILRNNVMGTGIGVGIFTSVKW